MKKTATFLLFFIALSLSASSQIYWNFSTPTPTTNSETNISLDTFTHGNNNGTTNIRTTTSASSGYTGASGTWNIGAAAVTGGFDPANSTYFQVTLTPAGSYSVVLTGISFGSRSTATGPQAFAIRSSADNFGSILAAGSLSNNATWTYVGPVSMNLVGPSGIPVILRIYGFNGTGSPSANTANWRLDDLTLYTTPLPITLISFDARVEGRKVNLGWTTADETDADKIIVEKSVNGAEFTAIASIAAKNEMQNEYSYTDNLSAGISNYRLRMLDKNGKYSFSKTISLRDNSAIQVQVYPNPAVSTVTITRSEAGDAGIIRILSLDGREVLQSALEADAVYQQLDVDALAKGTYIVQWQAGAESRTFPLIKL